MVKRGQFSRMHELSTDGATWVRASTRPELFENAEVDFRLADPEPPPKPAPTFTQSTPPAEVWYYHQLGSNLGPVDLSHLQFLASAGQLLPTDMVWKQGMPEWTPAGRVPGLFATSGAPTIQSPVYASGPTGRDLPPEDPPSVSGLAITSLALGILWIGGLGSILAIIFGSVSLYQIRISKGQLAGAGLAIAGLVLGIVLLALQIGFTIVQQQNAPDPVF
jgi:hypothetical protein